MAFHRVGEMMHVHHGALDAGIGQTIERVIDQRLAADLHQRLRDLAVVRPHARAEAGGQHDRALRLHGFYRPSPRPSSPIRAIIIHLSMRLDAPLGGRLAAYQALSGASAGCASDRHKYVNRRGK